MTVQFRDSFYTFVPPWLRAGNGEKYMYTLEFMRDLLMEKASQAQAIRLPGQGDSSQIPYLAYDRQLVQGPLESNDSFILRLQQAFPTWNKAGSAPAVLTQLQAYAQGRQAYDLPEFAIISNPRQLQDTSLVNTWWSLNYSDPIGTAPLLYTRPINFDWDGNETATWRCWLVVYQYLDAPHASGSAASFVSVIGGSFTDPGHNVAGVWVPRTSGTEVNTPFVIMDGFTGLTLEDVGSIVTLSGSASPNNNGSFQIVEVISATSCVIANPDNVFPDAATFTWSVASYPWIPPALAFGTPGLVWGEGQGTPPPIDTGENIGGVWQPSLAPTGAGEAPSYSWGLQVSSLEIVSIRNLVKAWKSAGTYYPNIIVSYGADEYSRTSPSMGNPEGDFGSVGKNVAGVWVPARLLASPWDAYCQGTGRAVACSVENIS